MEHHPFVAVVREGKVRVAEVAVVDLLPPARHDVVEMMRNAANRGVLWKPKIMEFPRCAQRIGHGVKLPADRPALPVLAPCFPQTTVTISIHSAVRTVTMKEEIASQV